MNRNTKDDGRNKSNFLNHNKCNYVKLTYGKIIKLDVTTAKRDHETKLYKGWKEKIEKKIKQTNSNQKEAGIAIWITWNGI